MRHTRLLLAGLTGSIACLSLPVQAQSPNLAGATYLSAEVGTGKVGLSCPAGVGCSRVDASGILRAGHRFDSHWAFEVVYSHVAADWGVLSSNYSAEFTGFGVGAAYHLPVSDSVGLVLRLGASSNELKFQPASSLGKPTPGTTSTSAVKPYGGLGLSWQFARHWSTSVNLDWTRADLREPPSATRQGVSVRTIGAGIAFNF